MGPQLSMHGLGIRPMAIGLSNVIKFRLPGWSQRDDLGLHDSKSFAMAQVQLLYASSQILSFWIPDNFLYGVSSLIWIS